MNYKLKYTGDQINNLLDKVNDMDPESYVTKEEGKGLSTNDFTDPLKNKLESLNTMIKVTWSELVSLRNNAQLIPGCFYRITDYECTTTQADTRSDGHPFDIIVLALTNNSLSEEARACLHSPDDNYFQNIVQKVTSASWNEGVTLEDVEILAYMRSNWEPSYGQELPGTSPSSSLHESAGVITQLTTFKNEDGLDVPAMFNPCPEGDASHDCYYVYDGTFTIDGEVYDKWHEYIISDGDFNDAYYLTQNLVTATLVKTCTPKCNMDAWRLKYSLDNNRFRYVWAHSMSINLELNERYYRNPKYDENGHWAWSYPGNETDVAYTDPNPVVGGTLYTGTYSSTSNTNADRITDVDSSEGKGVIYYMKDEYGNECPYDFKNIIFTNGGSLGFTFDSDKEDATIKSPVAYNNVIKENCSSGGFQLPFNKIINIYDVDIIGNVFGLNSTNNIIDGYNTNCSYNVLKNGCTGNHILGECNILGNNCSSNYIGTNSNRNVFADNCSNNNLQVRCSNNTFESDCNSNKLYPDVSYNYFGKRSSNNNLLTNANYTRIGCWSNRNTINANSNKNTIGNNCQNNVIAGDSNTLADNCQNIKMQGASGSISNYFGCGCSNITLGYSCIYNFFGSNCSEIKFVSANDRPLSGCEYIRVGDGCSNVTIKVNSTPLKNLRIGNSIKNKTIEINDQSLINADFEINIVAAENVKIEV